MKLIIMKKNIDEPKWDVCPNCGFHPFVGESVKIMPGAFASPLKSFSCPKCKFFEEPIRLSEKEIAKFNFPKMKYGGIKPFSSPNLTRFLLLAVIIFISVIIDEIFGLGGFFAVVCAILGLIYVFYLKKID